MRALLASSIRSPSNIKTNSDAFLNLVIRVSLPSTDPLALRRSLRNGHTSCLSIITCAVAVPDVSKPFAAYQVSILRSLPSQRLAPLTDSRRQYIAPRLSCLLVGLPNPVTEGVAPTTCFTSRPFGQRKTELPVEVTSSSSGWDGAFRYFMPTRIVA